MNGIRVDSFMTGKSIAEARNSLLGGPSHKETAIIMKLIAEDVSRPNH